MKKALLVLMMIFGVHSLHAECTSKYGNSYVYESDYGEIKGFDFIDCAMNAGEKTIYRFELKYEEDVSDWHCFDAETSNLDGRYTTTTLKYWPKDNPDDVREGFADPFYELAICTSDKDNEDRSEGDIYTFEMEILSTVDQTGTFFFD